MKRVEIFSSNNVEKEMVYTLTDKAEEIIFVIPFDARYLIKSGCSLTNFVQDFGFLIDFIHEGFYRHNNSGIPMRNK